MLGQRFAGAGLSSLDLVSPSEPVVDELTWKRHGEYKIATLGC